MITVREIDWFDARGSKRVGESHHHVGGRAPLRCEVFLSRDGTIRTRFWSNGGEVDAMCFEAAGLSPEQLESTKWSDPDAFPGELAARWRDWFTSECTYV